MSIGGLVASALAFSSPARPAPRPAARGSPAVSMAVDDPLLLRAARGEPVHRPPVWMMRQAGRHMKVYRDLCEKYPTFRERSEIAEVSTQISLQPWEAYKTDGVILFSDILTPLPGMGIDFDILEKAGPKIRALRTAAEIDAVHLMDPDEACPFVRQTLGDLRREVGNEATVLGFIGAPYTMATYCIEGGSSTSYLEIKKMGLNEPALLHKLLTKLADNLAEYACFQIDSGAQVIQMFDSWAGNLSPIDYDLFAHPYQEHVVKKVKARYPDVPFITYIAKSAALLERMANNGGDIVSVDWTVHLAEARARMGNVGVQVCRPPRARPVARALPTRDLATRLSCAATVTLTLQPPSARRAPRTRRLPLAPNCAGQPGPRGPAGLPGGDRGAHARRDQAGRRQAARRQLGARYRAFDARGERKVLRRHSQGLPLLASVETLVWVWYGMVPLLPPVSAFCHLGVGIPICGALRPT
jgi:uroporphyrinogen decarboxylase